MEQLIFYFFALCAVGSAMSILLSKKLIYNAISLLCTLLNIAGLYVFASAEFVAVVQLMIYIGGILVLIIFGVMFTNQNIYKSVENQNISLGILTSSSLFICLIFLIREVDFSKMKHHQTLIQNPSPQEIGTLLLTDYIWAFEWIGILLLLTLIGAVIIAGNKKHH
jgi:NADH-quinone oxidoreductase subunit J